MRGCFISFEGNEGSGKSTQIQHLAFRLKQSGREVVQIREPGGTDLGEEIRTLLKYHPKGRSMIPMSELLLIGASRSQLVHEVIKPALNQGKIVLCDRFYDSTRVYQGYARNMDTVFVNETIDQAVDGVHPDMTILISIPLKMSMERRRTRHQEEQGSPEDRFEQLDETFFRHVHDGYERLVRDFPERVKRVDGTGSVNSTYEQIREVVTSLLDSIQK
ncbi:MAG TPA: dTMP kinase [Verrucomicrobiales bacterium]|nr:dTMP kinase [Verrucomicrobiales bacterium]HIL71776.1 dTMP kinase [Verrucomicrobiota bacterium]